MRVWVAFVWSETLHTPGVWRFEFRKIKLTPWIDHVKKERKFDRSFITKQRYEIVKLRRMDNENIQEAVDAFLEYARRQPGFLFTDERIRK